MLHPFKLTASCLKEKKIIFVNIRIQQYNYYLKNK